MSRYIDADAILETMRSVMDMQELYLPIHFIDFVIDNMPTADVQEIKHGRWVVSVEKGKCVARCSVCKRKSKTMKYGKQIVPFYTPYCSICGAKMDGGDINERWK